ncbi:sugar transferase [Aliiruegeria lutimaris]|uniref:Sugar transferase involved in LPS biosynthesis (Colanic, teichoic acid) n=1 Tax=Aliiruegeria lutimaris TaxID=571298 RepID=A0A1G9DW69_9RHOB|nr:sugar transferase [Aliiruegeria lutimaris]SDK68113.1 Sugar transferase involved in LPS biosynthesis (colanic, teichoic acid) [Aliiruegeria lutimaris]
MKHYPVPLSVPVIFTSRRRYVYDAMDTDVTHWRLRFRICKFCFDKGLALIGLGLVAVVALLLLFLNPFLNPGPLFFRHKRLGKKKKPFMIWKFRTMSEATAIEQRSAEDGVENARITPLGWVMRKMRVDELPNFINVLRGDMSVIGPRPDAANHAETYSFLIEHYDIRFKVKPGITGLAQIESGYAEGIKATAVKAHYDQIYVETSCGRLDLYIALRTIRVMLTGFGAK